MKVTRAKSTGLVADVDVRGESERKARGYSQISGPAGGTDGEAVDLGQSIQEEKQEVTRCFLSLFCLKLVEHPEGGIQQRLHLELQTTAGVADTQRRHWQ